ncbi:MAG: hypothetical protein JNG89_18090, partial [Planctomycetaceae bacterium]|nr:hypothetical protein [Planctomycetaceae bacterium]
ELRAGAAKVDISHPDQPVSGTMYSRAIVLTDGETTVALIGMDVVSIGQIGYIKDDFLPKLRQRIEAELHIQPQHVLVNASHCHGIPAPDTLDRTFAAVKAASEKLVAVRAGVGTGHEDRVSENRRLKLKSGGEADVRHAYSLPPDEEVAEAGPIDPQIGILKLDALDGRNVAVVYNFACHPIQGMPGGPNTADMTGFASQVIEDNLDEGSIALFVQGCGGDINPIYYKDVDHPRSAEMLGNVLGLSTLKGVHAIETSSDDRFAIFNETIAIPREDLAPKIVEIEAEQLRLAQSLGGTSLNLKTFMSLASKYGEAPEFPSYYSHLYMHEEMLGRSDTRSLDEQNRRNMQAYIQNVNTMEALTRVNTNLALLKMHHAQNVAAGSRTIDVEVCGLRVGDFKLVTFPGELTVRIGLGIKQRAPQPNTFVAGYTNGYIYYCPTVEQLENRGYAQEDSDCILAPEWQEQFETHVAGLLERL